MRLPCLFRKIAAVCGSTRSTRAHAQNCPHCHEQFDDQTRIDALLQQRPHGAVGRAPQAVIAAVRAVARQAPASPARPRFLIPSAAIAAAILALLCTIAISNKEAEVVVTTTQAAPTPPPQLALPSLESQTPPPLELPLANDFESELALLAADFRRGIGSK